jgi:hypothetical protein
LILLIKYSTHTGQVFVTGACVMTTKFKQGERVIISYLSHLTCKKIPIK